MHTDPVPTDAGRNARILAIASGKGGVGKTWFAITLAHAWARAGVRTLLVDCDLGLANVDVQLGLMPVADIGAVASGRLPLACAVQPHQAGFDILAGRSGSGSLAALPGTAVTQLLQALRAAAPDYGRVILDLGGGLDAITRRLARFADELLVLVTDEPTSLTDAYASLKLFAADGGSVGDARVAVNQAASRAAGERTFATLRRACASFLQASPTLCGVVRADPHVRDAIRRQTPLLTRWPASAASLDVEAIAAALASS
ncbi:MAG: AAA family ATPase [Acidisphaera sp.]|nr:AAA family ATPase [Acidisphaera sp.]MBV9813429.1 AAA family ATPase [Acetobacteraceae bacterium]